MYSVLARRPAASSSSSRGGRAPEVAIHKSLRYPFSLTFYDGAPDLEISLQEFEVFALDRLVVLKVRVQ